MTYCHVTTQINEHLAMLDSAEAEQEVLESMIENFETQAKELMMSGNMQELQKLVAEYGGDLEQFVIDIQNDTESSLWIDIYNVFFMRRDYPIHITDIVANLINYVDFDQRLKDYKNGGEL